jgi:hypothetical protein
MRGAASIVVQLLREEDSRGGGEPKGAWCELVMGLCTGTAGLGVIQSVHDGKCSLVQSVDQLVMTGS